MIRSLDEAWGWYSAVKTLVEMMERISRRYWSEEVGPKTLEETLHRDDRFRHVQGDEIQGLAEQVMEDLDDLVVLLLFSVFEAEVRSRTISEMNHELDRISPPIRHRVLSSAIENARYAVQHGSFGRLTESYKGLSPNAKSMVDQVRRYRNWVAHGRRGHVENNIDPFGASERLKQFLALLDAETAEPGSTSPDVSSLPEE